MSNIFNNSQAYNTKKTMVLIEVYKYHEENSFFYWINLTMLCKTMINNSNASLFEMFDTVQYIYWVTQMLPQIYTANHATFPNRYANYSTDLR